MKEEKLEKKIRRSTKKKDFEKSKEILTKCYIKHFKKMFKYKKKKVDKSWYLYDYLVNLDELYELYYKNEIEEMIDILYSGKHSIKKQITWLLDNSYIFNDYKL